MSEVCVVCGARAQAPSERAPAQQMTNAHLPGHHRGNDGLDACDGMADTPSRYTVPRLLSIFWRPAGTERGVRGGRQPPPAGNRRTTRNKCQTYWALLASQGPPGPGSGPYVRGPSLGGGAGRDRRPDRGLSGWGHKRQLACGLYSGRDVTLGSPAGFRLCGGCSVGDYRLVNLRRTQHAPIN